MKKALPLISIIGGNGKMGQWFTNFFEDHNLSVFPIGRSSKSKIKDIVLKSDIVIISVPIAKTEAIIEQIAPFMKKDSLLTDITSLKIMPLKAMEQAQCATLGMHPLFGPGVTITKGEKIVFCKQKNNKWVDFLREVFQKADINIVEMSAEEHDYHMAYVQGLTQAINLLYAKIIFDQGSHVSKKLTTPLFTLQSLVMGRVIHQDLQLSADIQMYNPYFTPLLENLAAYSKKLLGILQEGKKDQFIALFLENQKIGKDFANFSMLHTDKILNQVTQIYGALPEKLTISNVSPNAAIAFLGPIGTYTHHATQLVFAKKSYKQIPYDTVFQVFKAVLDSDTDFGIVPAENSIEGTVKGTIDYLLDFSLHVVGSFALPIHHQLATHENKLEDITVVTSHPQALAQCEQWIRRHIPQAEVIPTTSTTASMQEKKKGHAYICSKMATKLYNMPIFARNIEDNVKNTTRFYVIAKKQLDILGLSNKKTLIFLTIYNRVGVLRDILDILAKNDINLTKLESRPSYEKVWDYHFFIEVEERYNSRKLEEALKELEVYCPVIRILGQT